jgi:hypothetical protein
MVGNVGDEAPTVGTVGEGERGEGERERERV